MKKSDFVINKVPERSLPTDNSQQFRGSLYCSLLVYSKQQESKQAGPVAPNNIVKTIVPNKRLTAKIEHGLTLSVVTIDLRNLKLFLSSKTKRLCRANFIKNNFFVPDHFFQMTLNPWIRILADLFNTLILGTECENIELVKGLDV